MNWNLISENWGYISLGVLALIVIGFSFLVLRRTTASPLGSTDSPPILYVAAQLFLIVALGILIGAFPKDSEIQLGFLVVIAIIALITLLFTVAAGFARLQLTDAKQALGLPEGSIRALIALVLIMVFVIFSVYLFRLTGSGYEMGPVVMTSKELADQKRVSWAERVPGAKEEEGKKEEEKFKVWLRFDLSPEGQRLAQQLVTTLGTLVVAIASFYFGSSAVSSAVAAVRGTTATQPTITSVDPKDGEENTDVPLTIKGKDFQMPRTVKLSRGTEEMLATGVMASGSAITAKVKLEKASGGDNWDVVVQNADGTETRLEKAFKINPSSTVAKAPPPADPATLPKG